MNCDDRAARLAMTAIVLASVISTRDPQRLACGRRSTAGKARSARTCSGRNDERGRRAKPIRRAGDASSADGDLLDVEPVDRVAVDGVAPSLASSRSGRQGCRGSMAASRLGAFGPLGAGHGLSCGRVKGAVGSWSAS